VENIQAFELPEKPFTTKIKNNENKHVHVLEDYTDPGSN
jgi:hypothetical protein